MTKIVLLSVWITLRITATLKNEKVIGSKGEQIASGLLRIAIWCGFILL